MSIDIDQFGYQDLEVRVYNPETKQVIKKYDTLGRASTYLGVSNAVLRNRCSSKKRLYSPSLKKEVAVRLVNKNKP
jgi:hypothetical protein